MDFRNFDSSISASSQSDYDSSFISEDPHPSPLDYKSATGQAKRKDIPARKPFPIPKITNLTATKPILISNSTTPDNDGKIGIQNTALAPGTRLIPSLGITTDPRPESKFLWAIASHQPIYILRSIGFHLTDLGKTRAFRRHPDPDIPSPLEACVIYDNLIALEYLVEDVAEHNLSVPKSVSYQDRDKLVALVVECRRDDALVYLFEECGMWKYSTHASIFNLAETVLVKSLEWRLEDMAKRNELVGWSRHTSLLACLLKALEADPFYQNEDVIGKARFETVGMLLRVGGKTMMRDAKFPKTLLRAVELERIKEAETMFSAWQGYGPWSNLNRELVSRIYLAASERSGVQWMARALVADYFWLAPRLGLQVDEDGIVVGEQEVETEPLTHAELGDDDDDGDVDSAVADLLRELDLDIDDRG